MPIDRYTWHQYEFYGAFQGENRMMQERQSARELSSNTKSIREAKAIKSSSKSVSKRKSERQVCDSSPMLSIGENRAGKRQFSKYSTGVFFVTSYYTVCVMGRIIVPH